MAKEASMDDIARWLGKMTPAPGSIPHATNEAPKSIVDSPVFKVLYNNPENLLQFATTKRMIPFAFVDSDKELAKIVHGTERGVQVDWDVIEAAVKTLEAVKGVREKSSDEMFKWFKELFAVHKTFVKAAACFLSYNLWVLMINAYYSPTGDIQLKSMFPLSDPDEMVVYLHESAMAMSPAFVIARNAELDKLNQEVKKKECAYIKIMYTRLSLNHFTRLAQLQGIWNDGNSESSDEERAVRIKKLDELNARRRKRRQESKQANMRRQNHQLGRQGLMIMENVVENMLSTDSSLYVSQFVTDGLPDVMSQTNHTSYPDSMDQLFTPDAAVADSYNT